MNEHLVDSVREKYGAVATSGLSSQQDGIKAVAEAFGYSDQELSSIPAEANMGLSCGNPTAFASLRSGEVVVDLGCGGGLDVFLAAQKVGPAGKAIGIDMTPQMLDLARRNASQAGMAHVEFHQATIDKLPLPDGCADCVISNCVINLAPDKPAVFREIARILKPGGRLAVSDIALKRPLPAELAGDINAYIGCIAGAILIEAYERGLREAGFSAVQVVDSGANLNAYARADNQSGCCSSGGAAPKETTCCTPKPVSAEAGSCCQGSASGKVLHRPLAELLSRYNINDYAASVKVYAVKPK